MTSAEVKAALAHLQQFLLARGWESASDTDRFLRFRAPENLGLPKDFLINVPQRAETPDAPRLVVALCNTVAQVYSHSLEQVSPVIQSADTVLSIRISDEETHEGSIELTRFDRMLRELKQLIVHTASFVTEDDPVVEQVPPEAWTFVDGCRFLQTERGSFVANVQMPSGRALRYATLLDENELAGREVHRKLLRVLKFVTGPVMNQSAEMFSDQHLDVNADVVNLNVLEDISKLFEHAEGSNLTFSCVSIEEDESVASGRLTPGRTAALANYVKHVRELLMTNIAVDVEGKVLELRSRNPQGNRNYVLLEAVIEGEPRFVAVHLDNERYGLAMQAHRTSRPVHIVGLARRMKTQLKIARLTKFTAT